MQFGLLGPLQVLDGEGRAVDLGGRQPRAMLARLLVADGRPVTVESMVDAIWGDGPPASAVGTMQTYVSRLRGRFDGSVSLVFDAGGYRLEVPGEQVDHHRFEALATSGRTLLDEGRHEAARAELLRAEALWRGRALEEFADLDFALGMAARLEERRLVAVEDRLGADLELGRHAAAVAELGELTAEHPLRERLQELHALALYRSGRQADALRVLAEAGRHLRDELGLEPSRPLRDLESAILAQDPSLDRRSAPLAVAPTTPPTTQAAPEVLIGGGTALSQVVRSSPAGGSPFVGRDEELAILVDALDAASKDAAVVVIEGEPGIGKTRLAEQIRLLALERGALAAWGRSDEGGAAPALWPWLAPLRSVAQHLGEPLVAMAELAGDDSPLVSGQADAVRYEWFESVATALERASEPTPVVVLLDDLQWADETSLELLGFLARRLDRGVLVVGTMRHLEVGRNDALTDALAVIARRATSRRIRLRGLTEEATSELLGTVTRSPVSPEVAAAVHERAEGNPFYAIELARLIDDEGAAQVPSTVGDVIRRRVGRLPEATREALSVAAVVGRDVPLDRVAAVSGSELDEVFDVLEPAVVQRLLVESPEVPGALRFSHALIREVLLDDLTPLRRARLHLRVADAIEAAGAGVDDAEILAEHLWRAAPIGVGRRAADALEAAADVAIRRVSYGTAEDLLLKAIRLRRASGSSSEDEAAELRAIYRWLEVARARRYFQGVDQPELLTRAKELAERCGERDVLLDVVWFEWSARATSSRVEEAKVLGAAHWDLTAHDEDPAVRARAHQVAGVLHWLCGNIDAAARSLDTGIELLAQAPTPTGGLPAELVMVSNTFSIWNNSACGNITPEEAFARTDALIATAGSDRFAVSSICGFAATTAVALGRWEVAERYAAIGRAADPESQFAFWSGQVLMQQGIALTWKGDLDRGLETFTSGIDRYTGVGGHSGTPTFDASVALHLARHGDMDRARSYVASARRRLDRHGERWNESLVLISEGVVAGLGGDVAEAERVFGQAVEVATAQGALALAERARREAALHGWEPR